VKRYVIDQVIAVLKENEHLKDEWYFTIPRVLRWNSL
jgi:hypothetical protein